MLCLVLFLTSCECCWARLSASRPISAWQHSCGSLLIAFLSSMCPIKSGFIFSSFLLLTILGKVPFECLPARGLFNSLCLLRDRRKEAQGYIVGGTFLIQTPPTDRTVFVWRVTLINLLGEDSEMLSG